MWAVNGLPGTPPTAAHARRTAPAVKDVSRGYGRASPRCRRRTAASRWAMAASSAAEAATDSAGPGPRHGRNGRVRSSRRPPGRVAACRATGENHTGQQQDKAGEVPRPVVGGDVDAVADLVQCVPRWLVCSPVNNGRMIWSAYANVSRRTDASGHGETRMCSLSASPVPTLSRIDPPAARRLWRLPGRSPQGGCVRGGRSQAVSTGSETACDRGADHPPPRRGSGPGGRSTGGSDPRSRGSRIRPARPSVPGRRSGLCFSHERKYPKSGIVFPAEVRPGEVCARCSGRRCRVPGAPGPNWTCACPGPDGGYWEADRAGPELRGGHSWEMSCEQRFCPGGSGDSDEPTGRPARTRPRSRMPPAGSCCWGSP